MIPYFELFIATKFLLGGGGLWKTAAADGQPSLKGIDMVKSWPGPGKKYNSPEEVLHGRTKYWHLIYIILKFAHICCCSSSHCGVPAFKLIHVLSLQASSDPTSDIGIV